MQDRDWKRLEELRTKQREGILSMTERIELDLLEDQLEEEREREEQPPVEELLAPPKELDIDLEEFELVIEEEKEEGEGGMAEEAPVAVRPDEVVLERGPDLEKVEEEAKRPSPPPRAEGKVDKEQVRKGTAFGAGLLMGFLLRDLLEDEEETEPE